MSDFIKIGESFHASIPSPGAAMKKLLENENDTEAQNFLISLVKSQAQGGADYIAVNVDEFGQNAPELSVKLMEKYVEMVAKHGDGVPVCVDSSDDNVLIAGLKKWYQCGQTTPPLINSVKTYNTDVIFPLLNDYKFKVIGLLISECQAGGPVQPEKLHQMAREIYDAAVKYGLTGDDIFFDTTVFPLAIDMPMTPGQMGYTYCAFQAMKMITNDPAMLGVHFSMGVTNCVKDLPARKIGVCRAYVQVARTYGLDAGIVSIKNDYSGKEADPELVKLVEAFAAQDGDLAKTQTAIELMANFCHSSKKK
ncbi:MAG: dihydropteroate synthase [Phycisphaerae bacterium]|nr:dihydropteroate synthase [Phycisphaerae bacterium]